MCGCASQNPSTPTSDAAATFASGTVQLSYALDLPAGAGPFPAFVLGHGSGRSTKAEAIDLAQDLVRSGYAVLRYDKRGDGGSTGVYEPVTIASSERVIGLLADDMAAGVRFLRTRAGIDASRVGIVGASQAGWVIPEAAARVPVHAMVLLSAPTVSVGEEIFYSSLAQGTTTGFEELSARLAAYDGPRGYDPRRTLATLSAPGLWMVGGQDRSVPTRETVVMVGQLAAAGHAYRLVVYEHAGHSLTDSHGSTTARLADILGFLDSLR